MNINACKHMMDRAVLKAKWLRKYDRHSRKHGTFIEWNGHEYQICIGVKALDVFLREFTVMPWSIDDIKYVGWEFIIPFDSLKDELGLYGHRINIKAKEIIERSY